MVDPERYQAIDGDNQRTVSLRQHDDSWHWGGSRLPVIHACEADGCRQTWLAELEAAPTGEVAAAAAAAAAAAGAERARAAAAAKAAKARRAGRAGKPAAKVEAEGGAAAAAVGAGGARAEVGGTAEPGPGAQRSAAAPRLRLRPIMKGI
ncbi:hypothetical protein AK812_SmicGene38344 [Symbiodinium microadriaticum]|uniref:Uncharacterized protein n=1 Tax=Symbiodinium microadriaticum TaxID=2951 RepID=A0A1Q9CE01_SYMMI|nr:hypothetical protein AK812_SmicGene38344 [Symbiodinium microadriaticum]